MVTPETTIDDCRIVPFPKVVDPRGNLTVIEGGQHVPFRIQRASWIYGVPAGEARAGRASREVEEIAVALSGSFDVLVDDGRRRKVVNLSQADRGFLVAPLIWCTLQNFSTNAACLILASRLHDAAAHIGDYETYRALKERSP